MADSWSPPVGGPVIVVDDELVAPTRFVDRVARTYVRFLGDTTATGDRAPVLPLTGDVRCPPVALAAVIQRAIDAGPPR